MRYCIDKLLWVAFVVMASVAGLVIGRRHRPTLIYGFTVYGAAVASLLGWILGVPNVARLLGTFLYPSIESAGRSDLLSRVKGYAQLAAKFTEVLAFIVPVKALIVDNDGTCGDEVANFLRSRSPVFFWMNGFTYQDICPGRVRELRAKLIIDDSEILVAWVGQLIPWKRVDRWLEVAAYVAHRRSNVRFLVLGDGRLRRELEKLALTLKLDDVVHFKGAVDYRDVWHYLLAADIFMSCHDLTNAANTLFEAMICGLPIVTIANGSTARFISSGQGVSVTAENPASLVERLGEAVIELADNPDLRKSMGQAGRRYAGEHLASWETRVQCEVETIETLIGEVPLAD